MYSFAQRLDTKVFDEPLYAYYLRNSKAKAYHPGAETILNTMENDGSKVLEMMMNTADKPVLFFKNMTHHLLDLDRSFMKHMTNIVLTRDPRDMLPSFDKVISHPNMHDVGYKMHIDLLEYFEQHKIAYVVLDAKNVLLNPERVLTQLCEQTGITFDKRMLTWQPSKREEDGVWAKYWYQSVHNSSGFETYQPKTEAFPEHLKPLLKECQPYYNRLKELALT
ncbi:MAG: sulfotransferase family protein [Algicola sp.]|nr:sulfotransferase family protein [Algicola sp.]